MIKYISIFRLVLRCLLVARKENLTGFSTGLIGRSKNLDPTGNPTGRSTQPVSISESNRYPCEFESDSLPLPHLQVCSEIKKKKELPTRRVAKVPMTAIFKYFFQLYFEATKQNQNRKKGNTFAAKKPFSDVNAFPFSKIKEC